MKKDSLLSSVDYARKCEKEEKKRADAREIAYSVVQRMRTTLLKYDLEISRANAEISLLDEKLHFAATSEKYKDKILFAECLARKENYLVFKNNLIEHKNALVGDIKMLAERYDGLHKDVFYDYFFEGKTYEELAEKTGYSRRSLAYIISKMKRDIEGEYKAQKKARS